MARIVSLTEEHQHEKKEDFFLKTALKTQVAPISSHGITPGYFEFGSEQTAFGLLRSASD